jgi:hypothetical protein
VIENSPAAYYRMYEEVKSPAVERKTLNLPLHL